MAADLILTNDGVQFSSGRILDIKAAMPSTGSYTAGDIVLESTTSAKVSGWKRLTTGSGHVLNTDWTYFSGLTSGTAVATTSGTAIDFTGIPADTKRITIAFSGVSTNGTSLHMVQLGSGSIVTTGYNSSTSTNGATSVNNTSGFLVQGRADAASNDRGVMTLVRVSQTVWTAGSCVSVSTGVNYDVHVGGGSMGSLGGAIDRIRLTTVGGTDTFDAGNVNILWE